MRGQVVQSSGPKLTFLGNLVCSYVNVTTATINISALYPNYANLTINDIIVALTAINSTTAVMGNVTFVYNNSTGVITMTWMKMHSGYPCYANVYVYK